MNLKDKILSLDKKLVDLQYINDTYIDDIQNLFLTIETESVNYSPCCYLDEDDNYVYTLVFSSNDSSQCIGIRKDAIVSFGFFNTGSESVLTTSDTDEESMLYQ